MIIVGAIAFVFGTAFGVVVTAVLAEGKQELLDRIKAHCKEHCAWLKNDKAVSEYALECLSSKAYKAWGMEE